MRFLLSRFSNPAELPACSIGRKEFFTLVHALLQSKLQYEDHFAEDAMFFQSREKNVAVLQFPLVDMPGPPLQPQTWYVWSHGTDTQGLNGILNIGKVLPTDAQVAGSAEGTFSFYSRASVGPSISLLGLRAYQGGWQASITAPRTAVASS